jgi:hypothetical protein
MSNIRIVLFDHLYRTKDWSVLGLQYQGQQDLDAWLGVGNVRLDVKRPSDRVLVYTLWRTYGPWYEDPKRFSDCNETINSWDENIFLGTDYQTGTYADFSTHTGPYIISPDVKSIFLREMREMARKHHGTRIKAVSVDNFLDHVELKIEY